MKKLLLLSLVFCLGSNLVAQNLNITETLNYINTRLSQRSIEYPQMFGGNKRILIQVSLNSIGEIVLTDRGINNKLIGSAHVSDIECSSYSLDPTMNKSSDDQNRHYEEVMLYINKKQVGYVCLDCIPSKEDIDAERANQLLLNRNQPSYINLFPDYTIPVPDNGNHNKLGYSDAQKKCRCCYVANGNSILDGSKNTNFFCIPVNFEGFTESDNQAFIKAIENAFNHLINLAGSDPIYAKKVSQYANDPFLTGEYKSADGRFTNSTSAIIHMTKTAEGLSTIPIVINGASKLDFIFDTGASGISLSLDDYTSLKQTNTMQDYEKLPSINVTIADGQIVKGKIVVLNYIELNGLRITNVKAIILENKNAPRLLGKNVLELFGRYTINNDNGTLFIQR